MWSSCKLAYLLVIKISQLLEIRMLQSLWCRPALIFVVYQHFGYNVLTLRRNVRNLLIKACAFLMREIYLHVCCMLSEVLQYIIIWRSTYFMDFVDLIKFIITWEQRTKRQDLVHHTANAPYVHFVTVIPIRQKAFRCSIPPRWYILRQRLILVQSSATSQISQFNRITCQQYIFRFNISMKYSISVHVFYGLKKLIHLLFDSVLR